MSKIPSFSVIARIRWRWTRSSEASVNQKEEKPPLLSRSTKHFSTHSSSSSESLFRRRTRQRIRPRSQRELERASHCGRNVWRHFRALKRSGESVDCTPLRRRDNNLSELMQSMESSVFHSWRIDPPLTKLIRIRINADCSSTVDCSLILSNSTLTTVLCITITSSNALRL